MEIVDWQNPNKVEYFDLNDYVSNIRIDSNVLEHMQQTNIDFDNYMRKITAYNQEDIVHLWLLQTANELVKSNEIEKHYVNRAEFLKKNLYFEKLSISNKRIHELHNFALQDESLPQEYRNGPVRVSTINRDGTEKIYWYGAESEDVPQFMNDFINIYKSNDLSVINSNPFIKSALIQLLFIRIHPYSDGNGRTARLLYSIKFTDAINKIYGTKLKLCPLNISASILMNQLGYVNILNNIYFDLEHDNNEWINKWFNYILNMVDEQLYYSNSKLDRLDRKYNELKDNKIALECFIKNLYGIKQENLNIHNLDNNEVEALLKEKTIGTIN